MFRVRKLLTVHLLLILMLAAIGCFHAASSPTPTRVRKKVLPSATTPSPTRRPAEVRHAAVAGQFYPDDPERLARMVDRLLADAERVDIGAKPVVLIVPHAGYVYSGHVAAQAFKQVEGSHYDVVVVIGTNHSDPNFDKVSVYARGAFETPLGLVPIDEQVAQALLDADPRIVFDRGVHRQEHSIEVELPFLQRLDPQLHIVPVIVGMPTAKNEEILADALADVLSGKKALVVASSDLSHYPAYDDAVRTDMAILDAIATLDPERFRSVREEMMSAGIPNLRTCACGEGPIITAMLLAQKLGATQVTLLRYANSGDTPFGNRDQVVGYGAVMFTRSSGNSRPFRTPMPTEPALSTGSLDEDAQHVLLTLARHTLDEYLHDGVAPFVRPTQPALRALGATFVTLKEDGELCGCIGELIARRPLYLSVQYSALHAALDDPRFPPVSPNELDRVSIEISVLSPPQPISVDEIQVGVHGLIIVKGSHHGVLLPQVPVEQGWDKEQYLRGLCRKAGLSEDRCWEDAQLYGFTAQVFGE
ncbi:MAG TPA: AmmeMemoRadiSam system protein B [Anaerolineae bacterium]|nr:AmmeMemoRadiSam system protein B [Anaerolineae bacterium]HIQ05991.1 AmmeMemoRadiSam system protein B [Anaerolineae bacterium]